MDRSSLAVVADAPTAAVARPAGALARILGATHYLLHNDFCPGANRWVYWLKNPLWILVLATVASVACGWFVNASVFVLAGALLVVMALGICWPSIALRGVDCSIEFSMTRVRVGDPVDVRLLVKNRRPWPVWGVSLDRGFRSEFDPGAGVALAKIAGWNATEFVWTFRPAIRGEYPLTAPVIETSFPFGLYRASRKVDVCGSLVVWPESAPLTAMPDAVELRPLDDRGSDRRAGDLGDILGTRAFRAGDSLRRVHWPQTARNGRLIVCERQSPIACAVRLVVDVSKASHSGRGADSTLEQALRVASSICESLHRQHAFIDCMVGNDRFSIGASAADLRRCLDALARVPGEGIPADHSACALHLASHGLPQVTVTGSAALRRHLAHAHSSFGQRVIMVAPAGEADTPAALSAECSCRPWLSIAADARIGDALPRLWRRACHAA